MPHARLAQVGAGIDAEEGHNGIVVRGVVDGRVGGVAGGIVSSKVAGVPADWFNGSSELSVGDRVLSGGCG